MYKWHAHSAIGRGRPVINDLAKVADGIAASLRQFSISAARAAEDGDAPPSRSQRQKAANTELLSMASTRPSRGIDARSLAAKPPPAFTITRVDNRRPGFEDSRGPQSSSYGRRNADGDGEDRPARRTPRQGGGRGDARGGGDRGGRGRGARARGGRGRGRGVKGPRRPKDVVDDFPEYPESEAERAYMDDSRGGGNRPYVPTTSQQTLLLDAPPVISSRAGVLRSLEYKFQVATKMEKPWAASDLHRYNIEQGRGTFFESKQMRDWVLPKHAPPSERMEGIPKYPALAGTLSKEARKKVLNQWVAGHYDDPGFIDAGKDDIMSQVVAQTKRNPTYLKADAEKFQAKLRSLLPAGMEETTPQQSNPNVG